MKKAKILAALLLVAVLLFTGCAGTEGGQTKVDTDDDEILIGVSFDSFLIERWQRDRDVFVSTANELGATVNVQNANGDIEEQISQIDYFIQKKVDAIVIVAIDCYALSDAVARAREAGIYVVAYDRLVMNADVDLYISFDNERVGELMAEALVESTPVNTSIISICGSQTDQNVSEVKKGFDNVISKSTLRVARLDYADGWLAETAYGFVSDAIEDGIVFSGVHCGNDDLASQAVIALSEHRLAGKVSLVGQDAELAACQRIVEGTQTMTVYKPVDKLARQAAECTVLLIKGSMPKTEFTINNGAIDVPFVKLEPIMVTKDNIDEVIIDGGFHRREEVYLNVN